MKKIIIGLALLLPLASFGATQLVKEIKWYEFIAQIQLQDGNTIFVNKFEDAGNTCYVMSNNYSINARTNGATLGISCVNTPVGVK